MKAEEDWLLEGEGEATAVNATVEEDVDPRIDLQGNGVSHLTMLKKSNFLTYSLSSLHNTLEAARTQHLPPVDKGMPPIEGPESSSHANTAPPQLNIPPPEKAVEPPDWPSPEQDRAPINVEGLLEPSPGEALQCITWHESLVKMPLLYDVLPIPILKS